MVTHIYIVLIVEQKWTKLYKKKEIYMTEKKYSKKYYIKRIKFLEELKNDYERRNNNDR